MLSRFSALTVALLLPISLLALGSPADGADALTEQSVTRSQTRSGWETSGRTNRGCSVARDGAALVVSCGRNEWASFTYAFAVLPKAINFRVRVDLASTNEPSSESSGSRYAARDYRINVSVGQGRHEIGGVATTYDLPTAYDSRPCVTGGEWARINVWRGGYGGSRAEIRDVFDTAGRRTFLSEDYDGFRYELRVYRQCGSSRTRKLTFHHYAGHAGWYSYWG